MGRKHALPMLTAAATATTVFVTVEPKQGQATFEKHEHAPALLMGTLEGRDLSVRIEATEDGTRYSVIDASGAIVASGLDANTLRERYPLLAPGAFYATEQGSPLGPLMMVPDSPGF